MASKSSLHSQFFMVFGKHLDPPKATSESDGDLGDGSIQTNLLRPGQTSSIRSPSPKKQPHIANVVLIGEHAVKSSIINLIAREEIARVSAEYQRYDISFDNMNFAIFDTVGLEEPQMRVNECSKAIETAYDLISMLGTAGGIHLLLFCMRGGEIVPTTWNNYRLFCKRLRGTTVPIALVFTGLEREVEMEDWWRRNKRQIKRYGIKSNDHAWITTVPGETPGEESNYVESQETIRRLLKTCAPRGDAFMLESYTWHARMAKQMKGFLEAVRQRRVLAQRCKPVATVACRGDGEALDINTYAA